MCLPGRIGFDSQDIDDDNLTLDDDFSLVIDMDDIGVIIIRIETDRSQDLTIIF